MDVSNRVKLLFKYSIALRRNEVNVPLTTWININYKLLNVKKKLRKKYTAQEYLCELNIHVLINNVCLLLLPLPFLSLHE